MEAIRSKTRTLLYGAYGYTGRLTAELAASKGFDLVLAGRDKNALGRLGRRLRFETRVVGLTNATELAAALQDIACVIHMAGPFAMTATPMLNACLATRTNYIDITGEIAVFEAMWSRKEEIRQSGTTVIPGAGFDVIPTDCLARYVASKCDHPASLAIAVRALQSVSQGTLRTAIQQVSRPVLCRRDAAIVAVNGEPTRELHLGSRMEPYVPVSWGDVATAFYSTGVRNITVYIRRTKLLRAANFLAKLFGPILRSKRGQRVLAAIVRMFPEGPSLSKRRAQKAMVWAESSDLSGKSFRASLFTPGAYDFAANSALEVASRIDSLPAPLGLVTPSQAFGADFVLSLPGCSRQDIPTR
ncbi:MAG: saccharopine dehydrogenase NADP-binding domain-containing protein [Acidobacteriota bacterium]|nr:saccharopine dehydrogenase NADP-binding domain-containing protein [Acidobacteriota bacterium]